MALNSVFKSTSRSVIDRSASSSVLLPSLSLSRNTSNMIHNYDHKSGFDGSGSSGLYNKSRPDYPSEAICTILTSPTSTSSNGLNIIELGSGTGICSRLLLNPPSSGPKVNRLLAFEPSTGMRTGFENNVIKDETISKIIKEKGIEIKCQDGTFESFKGGEGENDLVVIAQAWHWCPNFNLALSSISKSLKPGGILALIWNLEDRETAPWVGKLRDFYEVHEDNTPQYRHNYWHSMYSTHSMSNFTPLEALHFNRNLTTDLRSVVERVLSKSYISILDEEKKAEIESDIKNLLGGGDDQNLGRVWIDKEKGTWEYPYRTDLFMFQKK